MRILVAAVTAVVLLAAASAGAQSLEKTYADLCADPAQAKSESCVVLAQALVAKLQGQSPVAPVATSAKPATAEAPAGSAVVAAHPGDSRPAPVGAAIATSSTGTGTKQDPIPLALGQKVTGRLDDNSPRSGIMRSRSAFYRLAGRQGQTVVVGLDCDVHAFYACIYTAAVPEKTLGYELELADSPVLHAWRVTLKADNPLLHVYSNGTVEYAVVVQDGAAGDALWAEAKSARARSDAAVAQEKRERSAERGALFGAVMQGLAQGAAEVDTGGYAEAQANLDATVANINAAAAAERQQQALAQQQAQARATEEQRAQLAENARWVAEKEQAAAEYRSGQVEAAAAREAQLQEQQRATEQRRAAAEVERRNAEQAATIERQKLQAAALAERAQVAARPVASTEQRAPASPTYQAAQDSSTVPATGRPIEMFVFFVNLGGKTVAFEGPLAMTRAEGDAMQARLAAEAPGKYGAGAIVDARSRGGGWCAFVYQRPGEQIYIMGSETSLSTATKSMKGQVSNAKAVIHHDVVCPTDS